MTQDERWMVRYKEVMEFLEENHRNPSKHRGTEGQVLSERVWRCNPVPVFSKGNSKLDILE